MKLKIAIIEDEPLIARSLKAALQTLLPESEVIAMLESVTESVDWLGKNKDVCDLMFMDIRLSDGLSFQIFEQVQPDAPVIFITAYNDYALEAFKANGIAYILKPFDEEELAAAINKLRMLREGKRNKPEIAVPDLVSILQQIQQKQGYKKSMLVHYRDRLIPLNINEVCWFYTQNEVVHAAVVSGTLYFVEGSLEKLQLELDPQQFFRANRQFLVNRTAIKEVDFFFNSRLSLKVLPAPPEAILISKARVSVFKDWMNQ